jgi:hypothetical protein
VTEAANSNGMRPQRLIGGILLANYMLVVIVKVATGRAIELLWMSHVGLLAAGAGFICGSELVIYAAFVGLAGLHGLWLYDAGAAFLTGAHPLGITRYLSSATLANWLGTLHHFYLLPLLVAWVSRRPGARIEALLLAIATFLALTVICRFVCSPADNVNFAYGVDVTPRFRLSEWGNRQSASVYLVGLNTFVALVYFAPAYAVTWLLALLRRVRPTHSSAVTILRA